jgi:Rps23 Pro-64 3,4-dihydroxylase Tpa1-like proline 4-hydroxylase
LISPCLNSAQYSEGPFPHVFSQQALDQYDANRVLRWLEMDAPWALVEESFYEQYEFSLRDAPLPLAIAPLVSVKSLLRLKTLIEEWFGTHLSEKVDVTAHKLVAGQTIRIHNDFIPGEETHRLLIQLNRGWNDENGGLLMFFNSPAPNDLNCVFRPTHNSCVAFEISGKSLHAVSTIHAGERFTLVYSFFSKI